MIEIAQEIYNFFAKIIRLFISRWLKVQKKFKKTPQLLVRIINGIIYLIALF